MRSTVLLPLFAFLARPILATDATYCSKQNTGSSFKATRFSRLAIARTYAMLSTPLAFSRNSTAGAQTMLPGIRPMSPIAIPDVRVILTTPVGITTTSAPAETTSSESVGQIVPITIHATPTSQPTVHPDHKSSGLSGGGIAGVVIGCVGGVALILAAVGFYIAKRRSRSRDTSYAGSVQNMLPDGRQTGSSSTTMRMPTFTDNRLKTDTILFPNGRRDSSVSLQDNEDYSRPVLRLTNPD
ncbi:hypothetical protein MPDQ_004286 [Monascus purpureus]|uniref:Mid2 domain-containing protein n=1 Tax=Monascus purpureus TaxID=5098 RepID=A0A507QK13_MONPU|nr:hypothetical protein MPDQ_004286 [Monascus purpureus]